VSLVKELLENFEPEITSLTLVPANDGRFEVKVDNEVVFSKFKTGRHAEPGEAVSLIRKNLFK
jgi:selenoprotein W-related protein